MEEYMMEKEKKRQTELIVKTQRVINFLSVFTIVRRKNIKDNFILIQFRISVKKLTFQSVTAKAEENDGRLE